MYAGQIKYKEENLAICRWYAGEAEIFTREGDKAMWRLYEAGRPLTKHL